MDYEQDLLSRLETFNSNRSIRPLKGAAWGHCMEPAPDEVSEKTDQGLRVLIIGSWTLGILAFEAVQALEQEQPEKVNIVGLVTDDPLDPDARISVSKRFWRYYGKPRQEQYELDLLEEALRFGVPCYTGEVKNRTFRDVLSRWNPETIVMAGFGQLIDAPIIRYPKFGMYNVHPSDLRNGQGAGPKPWEDVVQRRASTVRVSIHQVNEEIDSGPVVGVSPPVNVRLKNDECTDNIRLIGEKTFQPVKGMVRALVEELVLHWQKGENHELTTVDMESCFSEAEKNELMSPLDPAKQGTLLPLSSECADDSV